MSNRYAVLSEDADESERRSQVARGRRLVLVSQNHDAVARDHEWDPDTESIRGASDVEEDDVPALSIVETLLVAERIQARTRAFASLDAVNLVECFNHRPRLMQTVPWVMRGAFRSAVQGSVRDCFRGEPSRGGTIPRQKLEARIQSFQQGMWSELLHESATSAERAHTQAVCRRRRQDSDDDGRRVSRALSLVRMGELSAARQALEGAPVAPGTMATFRALTHPERRPPLPREG